MSYRPKRYGDLTEEQRVTLEDIRRRHKEEHDALSESFYQKKRSAGVSPQEQAAFDAQHDAIHQKYEQEMLQTGLLEEYDELEEMSIGLTEMVADINRTREQQGQKPLEIKETQEG